MSCVLRVLVNWTSRAELAQAEIQNKLFLSLSSIINNIETVPETVLSNCSVVTAFWPCTEEFRCCRCLKWRCRLWVCHSLGRKNLPLCFCTSFQCCNVFLLSDPTSSCWLSVGSSMPSVASPSPTWSATTRRMTGGTLWPRCQTLLQNSQLVNARARSTSLGDTRHEVTSFVVTSWWFLPDYFQSSDDFLLFFWKAFELV